MDRRRFLGTAGAAGGTALVVGTGLVPKEGPDAGAPGADARKARPVVETPSRHCPELAALLAPLSVGSPVGDFRVYAIERARTGAGLVVLVHGSGPQMGPRGPRASLRVDVCARDADTPGIAGTERYDLFLQNGGRGDLPTDEASGLAVMQLADVIRSNEKGRAGLALPTKRQTWTT